MNRRPRRNRQYAQTELLEPRIVLSAFTPGNIVVSNSPLNDFAFVYEYDTSGNQVQAFQMPNEQSSSEKPRDLAVDAEGNAWLYDGTFQPRLTQLNPTDGSINSDRTFENWSTANNLRYGGLFVWQQFAFATDTKTAGDAESDVGIVRFRLDEDVAVRFGSDQGRMIDVTVGLDGKVYALGPSGSPSGTHIHVYHPETLAFEKTIELQHQSSAIAVNAQGTIFSAGGPGGIRKFNQDGNQVDEALETDNVGSLADIDLDGNGNILVASHGGNVGITTEALESVTSFSTRESNGFNFAAWVPVPPVTQLSINLEGETISEIDEPRTAVVTRSGKTVDELVVTLNSSDTTEIQVPQSVTFGRGVTSVEFALEPVDDLIADGARTVFVTAEGDGASASAQIVVLDNEDSTLELSSSANAIAENGGSTTFHLSRNFRLESAVVVTLTATPAGGLSFPQTVEIPAGQQVSEFTVTAIDNDDLAENTEFEIRATVEEGLSATKSIIVEEDDVPEISLAFAANAIDEDEGLTTLSVSRNFALNSDLTVELTADMADRLQVPKHVIIPSGQSTFEAVAAAIDNELVSGNITVEVTAAAEGLTASTSILIEDDEDVELLISSETQAINENGGRATFTVSHNVDTDEAVTVELSADLDERISIPQSIEIPAGQASVNFVAEAVDNNAFTGDVTVIIGATGVGLSRAALLVIEDDEEALFTLQTNTAAITEDGGSAMFKLTRNFSLETALVATLSSDPTGRLQYPETVEFEAGQRELQFEAAAIDNDDYSGDVAINMTASAENRVASDSIVVEENDLPRLILTIQQTELAEGGPSTTGRITRQGDISEEILVSLQSSSSSDISFPTSIRIEAGEERSVPFVIRITDDTVRELTETVVITAEANDFATATAEVFIEDNDRPPREPGNVDDDGDFDGNDAFLIQLIMLAGTNTQVDDFTGASSLTSEEIRTHVNALETDGDVDGNSEFNANDAFLILLVSLAGTDAQVETFKGASSLTAAEIRSNIEQLGVVSQASATQSGAVASLHASPPAASPANIFATEDQPPATSITIAEAPETAQLTNYWSNERNWLELI